jgi:hypothetical protein
MRVLDDSNGRIILKRGDGAILFIDDNGFSMKNIPDNPKQVKTTEWSDWYAMNELINKISGGYPRIRS